MVCALTDELFLIEHISENSEAKTFSSVDKET